MKTQHTPYLAFDSQFESENFQYSAIVDNPSEHAKKTDEATAGNITYRYIPLPHVVRCVNRYDELLKENEQLKEENERLKLNASPSEVSQWERANKAEALNAELLEALKEQTRIIQSFAGIEAWVSDRELKEKWQAKIYPSIEKAQSVISKAEGKP